MNVIMITGKAGSGKTTTINLIYCQLRSIGAIELEKRTQVGNNPLDFQCLLEHQSKRRTIKIGFFSMGDTSKPIYNALEYYNNIHCDFLIIANRNYQDITEKIKADYDGNVKIILRQTKHELAKSIVKYIK